MRTGCGVQGPSDIDRLSRIFNATLVLQGDEGLIQPRPDMEFWYRPMHGVTIDDPGVDARGVTISAFLPYHNGCRTLVFPNEYIAVEGPPATEDNYKRFNAWGVEFVSLLKESLQMSGMGDMRIVGPSMSPGHQEDDGFEGYRLLKDYLSALDGISTHYYWRPDGGFLHDPDAIWWSKRIEMTRAILVDLGLGDKPISVTEFNRKTNRADSQDIANYCGELREYYAYLAGLGYVEAAFTFLATCKDPAFADLTLAEMPGALDQLDGLKDSIVGVPMPPTPTSGGYTVDSRGFDSRFSAYVNKTAARRKWTAANDPSTDEYAVVRQDFTYTTAGGAQKYGTLVAGSGLNGFDDGGVWHEIYS